MKDLYNILGVEPGASNDEIKRMYHKLSKKYHPDANISDPDLIKWSEARMKELNEAYDTLKDPVKRAFYDRQRGYGRPQPPPSATAASPSPFTQFHRSIVVRSAATNALIFGLFGLMRGGIPFAISGAAIGAMIGAIIGNLHRNCSHFVSLASVEGVTSTLYYVHDMSISHSQFHADRKINSTNSVPTTEERYLVGGSNENKLLTMYWQA